MKIRVEAIDARIVFLSPSEPWKESSVPCEGCPAPCCRMASKVVLLSYEEARRLPISLAKVNLPGGTEFPFAAALPKDPATGECVFLTPDRKCRIWDRRPGVCRSYDCRQDTDPEIKRLVEIRFPSAPPAGTPR